MTLLGGFHRLTFLLSRRRELLGIEVGALLATKEEAKTIHDKVEAALRMIKDADPRQFARLEQCTRGILIRQTIRSIAGEWLEDSRLCVLSDRFVLDDQRNDDFGVAMVLVHESMHAWLSHRGIDQLGVLKERAERICLCAEKRFLHKLGLDELVPTLDAYLLSDEPLAITDAESLEQQLELIEDGIPWLAGFLRRFFAWRNRRAP